MNKKAIIINGLILGLLAAFVIVSITIYYLVPIAGSVMDRVREALEELISIISSGVK